MGWKLIRCYDIDLEIELEGIFPVQIKHIQAPMQDGYWRILLWKP